MQKKRWLVLALSAVLACVDLTPPQVNVADGPMLADGRPTDGAPSDRVTGDGPEREGPEDLPGGTGGTGGTPDAGGAGGAGGGGNGGNGGVGGGTPAGGAGGTTPDSGDGPAPPPPDLPPPLKANGQACVAGGECASGACGDQVCCNTGCTGICESCILAGNVGTCSPLAAGTDPADECATEAASTCRQDGTCNGARGCRQYLAGTSCGAASCSGGVETPARTCNGQGTCSGGATRACAPHLCGATACATTCVTPADCAAGASCIGGACVVATGLQLYWSFDEASGTQASDLSGQGRHGTYGASSTAPTTSTTVPPAVQFPNPRSRAFVAASRTEARLRGIPSAMLPSNNVTLSAWFRATSVGNASGLAEIATIADGFTIYIQNNSVGVSKRIGSNNYLGCDFSTAAHLDGNWHHLAGISTPSGLSVYLDGVLRTTVNSALSVSYGSPADFLVGSDMDPAYAAFFGGHLDEIRMYNRALSAAEVMSLATGNR